MGALVGDALATGSRSVSACSLGVSPSTSASSFADRRRAGETRAELGPAHRQQDARSMALRRLPAQLNRWLHWRGVRRNQHDVQIGRLDPSIFPGEDEAGKPKSSATDREAQQERVNQQGEQQRKSQSPVSMHPRAFRACRLRPVSMCQLACRARRRWRCHSVGARHPHAGHCVDFDGGCTGCCPQGVSLEVPPPPWVHVRLRPRSATLWTVAERPRLCENPLRVECDEMSSLQIALGAIFSTSPRVKRPPKFLSGGVFTQARPEPDVRDARPRRQ